MNYQFVFKVLMLKESVSKKYNLAVLSNENNINII